MGWNDPQRLRKGQSRGNPEKTQPSAVFWIHPFFTGRSSEQGEMKGVIPLSVQGDDTNIDECHLALPNFQQAGSDRFRRANMCALRPKLTHVWSNLINGSSILQWYTAKPKDTFWVVKSPSKWAIDGQILRGLEKALEGTGVRLPRFQGRSQNGPEDSSGESGPGPWVC